MNNCFFYLHDSLHQYYTVKIFTADLDNTYTDN